MKKLLLADDHHIFREGLVLIIRSKFPEWMVHEAYNGEEALKKIVGETPDLAILDLSMPIKSGIDVLRALQTINNSTPCIILTMHREYSLLREAMALGARGFVLKEDASKDILECIAKVLEGGKYISGQLGQNATFSTNMTLAAPEIKRLLVQLTEAERSTLKLIAMNKKSKEIADMLFVTPKTVENYRSRICKKLELDGSSNSLLTWALEHKELLQ